MKENGFTIIYRLFGGNGKQSEELPYPNYGGYFIQFPDMVEATKYGIFISFIGQEDSIVSLCLEKYGESDLDPQYAERLNELWDTLIKILFTLHGATISCGNCEFTSSDWEHYRALAIDKN